MTNYNDFKEELLRDSEVKAEYDALESEFNMLKCLTKGMEMRLKLEFILEKEKPN